MTVSLDQVERLRSAAERLSRAADADMRLAGALIQLALANPSKPAGAVLGLPPKRRGGEPAWRAALRHDRDEAFVELSEKYEGKPERKVCRLLDDLKDYETRSWPIDRVRGSPPADPNGALMFRIMSTGVQVPGAEPSEENHQGSALRKIISSLQNFGLE
jgi:hypothetical protein